MSEYLLEANQIAKSYGAVAALRSANLLVERGQVHALLGANGAGKSTFVKILTGITSPSSGTFTLEGKPYRPGSPRAAAAAGIAPVFQDPALVPGLTVRQNMKLTGTSPSQLVAQIGDMGLTGFDLDELVSDIPLPFLRMIDLARALAQSPRLLVLDEITAALPPDLSERVFEVMRQHVAKNGAVLFISHRLDEVETYCTMCTVFRDGGDVERFDPGEGGQARIVKAMLGPLAGASGEQAAQRAAAVADRAPRLHVEDLGYGDAIRGVSLEVRAGEVLGVAALEGQGQNELFEVLAGDRRATTGTITVNGSVLRARHPADAIRKGVVLVPSDRVLALLPHQSVQENIALPMRAPLRAWGPIHAERERRTVNSAISRLSIDTRAASQVSQLSGGNQQKVTIARWLARGFQTLLLFDPTRGIDVGTKRQIYGLIRQLADEGTSILMFTSELREIEMVCDRAVVMYGGRVVAEYPPDAGEEALLSAAHGLTASEASGMVAE